MRILVLGLVLAVATPASADDDAPLTYHRHQFGISARLGVGVRGIATYNSDYCGTSDSTAKNGNAPVCAGRAPLSFDLEASYGVGSNVELLLDLQIGIERDFGEAPGDAGPRQLNFAPGVRIFFSDSGHTRLFVQPEAVFDFADYTNTAGMSRGDDFGLRVLEGLWIDLHRTYGVYFYVAQTAEVARWLEGESDLGVGFQARYP